MSKTRSIEIPLTMDSFEAADRFIEQWLAQNRFSKDAITETKLLFEALFRDMIEQGFDQNTMLTIKAQRSFGEYNIKFGFEGKPYVPVEKEQITRLFLPRQQRNTRNSDKSSCCGCDRL